MLGTKEERGVLHADMCLGYLYFSPGLCPRAGKDGAGFSF